MKKTVALILVLMMVFSLTGCKSKEAKLADKLITDIGEVTLDSENAINYAEASYASLSDEDKASVEGLDTLTAARAAYDELVVIKNADELIAKVGEVDYTQVQIIKEAYEAYDDLSEEAKGKVVDAAKIESAKTKLDELLVVVGSWIYDFDLSEQMNIAMTEMYKELGQELTAEGAFSMPILFIFNEDGSMQLTFDKDLMSARFSEYLAPYVEQVSELTYSILLKQYGLSKEDADNAYMQTYSMTVEEYSAYALSEGLNSAFAAIEASADGTYRVDGNKLYILLPSEGPDESYYEFTVDSDTLTFISTDNEGDMATFEFPMVLTKK